MLFLTLRLSGTQIAIAQISVRVVKAWILRGDEEEEAEDKERNE